jgi:hypothetical protein
MSKRKNNDAAELIKEWRLPTAATLGSNIRAKGIFLEIRARLPLAIRKSLDMEAGVLTLTMPETSKGGFRAASAIVATALDDIAGLPVIPREIQDILAITTTERHRWLDDGRLPSAGTRTVKLRGRARKITFHIFDPQMVEDVLDRDLVTVWREEDVQTAAENRRRAALKAKLTRSLRDGGKVPPRADGAEGDTSHPQLTGWEEFMQDGLLK